MNEYWFRPKTYGYGVMPITWQGWAVTLGAVIVIPVVAGLTLGRVAHSPWALVAFFAIEGAVLAALWIVCRRKTDGELRWRWGSR